MHEILEKFESVPEANTLLGVRLQPSLIIYKICTASIYRFDPEMIIIWLFLHMNGS